MHPLPSAGEILVVEDPMIGKLVRGILRRFGYTVSVCDIPETLARMRSGNRVMVITNTPAPFLEFAGAVPLLYLGASPDPDLAGHFQRCYTLAKPFHPRDLLNAVRQLAEAGVP
jgi:CheY-like chemotaxis protein